MSENASAFLFLFFSSSQGDLALGLGYVFIFEKSILSFANLDQIEEKVLRGRSVKKMTDSRGCETCHCQRTHLFFLTGP